MIQKEDFKKNKNSISCTIPIKAFNTSVYIVKNNNDEKASISGYCPNEGKYEYICRVDSIKEYNRIYTKICERLTFLSKFQEDINLLQFYRELHKEYTPNERQKRFNESSDDGIITVYVKKEYDMFVPRVIDYEKGTNNRIKAHITSACSTEKEANEICLRVLNEYNIHKKYKREIKKSRKLLEHELTEDKPTENEYYIYENGVTTPISQEQLEKIKIMIKNNLI